MTAPAARTAPTVAAGLLLAAAGYALAERVVPRLSDHRGFFLLAHDDRVTVAPTRRPRRAVVVVVDGLRQDDARRLGSIARVRAAGRCAVTDVGVPSVSRPVYAAISSGVEQARTGARNNDDDTPVAVDSLWERARAAGLRVTYRSELPWWGQLFPRGFDAALVLPTSHNLLAAPFTDDLTLVHPVYVDEASHDHGVGSAEQRAAVTRADRELSAALDGLDLTRDLVVVTADHGHRDAGGHGGPQPVITEVLTCFGGAGVRRDLHELRASTTDLAPTLAVLLGVAIPHHAGVRRSPRALIEAMADRAVVGSAYLDARLRSVEHIAQQGGDWSARDDRARLPQLLRGGFALLLGALAVAETLRRAVARGERARALGWGAAVVVGYLAAYRGLSGGLDASSINRKSFFVRNVLLAAAIAYGLGALEHRVSGGSWRTLAARAWAPLVAAVAGNVAHVAAFGWLIGYPMPGPYLYFAPFLMASYQTTAGLALVGFALAAHRPKRGA
jgi:hypothetical protein